MRYPQQINVSIEKLEETTSTNDYLEQHLLLLKNRLKDITG